MSKLTKAEKAWVDGLNKMLAACPSDRIGFATIGDRDVTLFDMSYLGAIGKELDRGGNDFVPTAAKLGATFSEVLNFPNPVESTAG